MRTVRSKDGTAIAVDQSEHGPAVVLVASALGTRADEAALAHPVVELVTTTYQTGVTLTKEAMAAVEAQLMRLPHLSKYFVDIPSHPPQV